MSDQKSDPKTTLLIVSIAQFFTPYMTSAVGVAIPAIGMEFKASAFELGLIQTAYMLGISLFLVPSGRMADIKGRKKVYTLGILLFTITTAIILFSKTMVFFIALRFLQGAGASLIMSTSIAILTSVFPANKRGKAMGIVVACVYLGLSAGPGLGGLLVTGIGWRFVFVLVIPFQLIALYLTFFKLKGEWKEAENERFDWGGTIIYMAALFLLILGATRLDTSAWGVYLFIAGLLGVVGFVVFESYVKFPILNVLLLRNNRVFALSNLATMINYASSFGITFLFAIYLQVIKGFSARDAGFILIAQPVIQAVFSPVIGRLSDRFSSSKLATLGMAVCAVSLFLCSFVTETTSIVNIYLILIIMGTGFAIFSSPNMNAVMSSVESKYYGFAASFVATMRTIGMLVSMTFITFLFSVLMGELEVSYETKDLFLATMKISFILFSGLSVLGVFCSMGRISKN
ncbi:MAG: MFS transporter [Desulforegulaceae bacterium]|nr:MFS transporter [Desulforegulaceae bacterium]